MFLKPFITKNNVWWKAISYYVCYWGIVCTSVCLCVCSLYHIQTEMKQSNKCFAALSLLQIEAAK